MPTVNIPKVSLSTIKDILYVGGIVVGVIFFFRDKWRNDAITETKLQTVIDNQKNIIEWLKEHDIKLQEGALIDEKTLTLLELLTDE